MGQATRHGHLTFTDHIERLLREGGLWAFLGVSIYLALSLISYSPNDPGWSYIGNDLDITNAGGRTGAWFADAALYLCGYLAYLLPFMIAWSAWLLFRGRVDDIETKTWLFSLRWVGFFITLAAGCGFAAVNIQVTSDYLPNGAGGGLGLLVSGRMRENFGFMGANLLFLGTLIISLTLFFNLSWLKVIDLIGALTLNSYNLIERLGQGGRRSLSTERKKARGWFGQRQRFDLPRELQLIDPNAALSLLKTMPERMNRVRRPPTQLPPEVQALLTDPDARPSAVVQKTAPATVSVAEPPPPKPKAKAKPKPTAEPKPEPAPAPPLTPPAAPRAAAAAPVRRDPSPNRTKTPPPAPAPTPPAEPETKRTPEIKRRLLATFARFSSGSAEAKPVTTQPPLTLLDAPRPTGQAASEEQIEHISQQLEAKLAHFGVQAQVVDVYPGPVVTLFELQLAPGVKASKITGLAQDLARALRVVSVRVVEIIPGKSVVGIEIPNPERQTVLLRTIFDSPSYRDASSPLTIGLGTNISGLPVVADLARMHHALIAGTADSGQTVAIHAMILSLLYKSDPEAVRLILIDAPPFQLGGYAGLPHLLAPVIADPDTALQTLQWCANEMERRARLMSKLGVRTMSSYNQQLAEDVDADRDAPPLQPLPYIVVVINELAALMPDAPQQLEELFTRFAQKGRACGIHLLVATQYPSTDVLTETIKAALPTRLAFQVASRLDSRTILDQLGAEQLLGQGDMLYLPPGGNIPHRVHGALVDAPDIARVVAFFKTQYGAPDFAAATRDPAPAAPPQRESAPPSGHMTDLDPFFDEAVRFVVMQQRASSAALQRHFQISQQRAARLMSEMERLGIVGPTENNGERAVFAPPPRNRD